MAKIIRKYWWIVLLQASFLVGAAIFLSSRMLHEVQTVQAQPAPPQPVDIPTYCRVQELRSALALTNQDLAAMGCSQANAESVIGVLKTWQEQNVATWATTAAALRAANSNYRQTLQQANLGPNNSELNTLLASRKTALDSATAAWNTFLNGASSSVTAVLSSPQNAIWTKAKANVGKLGRYRYASGISAQNLARLSAAIARYGEASSHVSALEGSLLGAQASDLSTARSNLNEKIVGVVAADSSLLAQPEELRLTPTAPQ